MTDQPTRAMPELIAAAFYKFVELPDYAEIREPLLVFLARRRPQARCLGVEASLLVWFLAWFRALPVRANCRMRLGSLWELPLGQFQLVYAVLSPVPMPALWDKARQEMAPGTLLVSNSFEIPGVPPEREIPLPGRKDARLWLYRIP